MRCTVARAKLLYTCVRMLLSDLFYNFTLTVNRIFCSYIVNGYLFLLLSGIEEISVSRGIACTSSFQKPSYCGKSVWRDQQNRLRVRVCTIDVIRMKSWSKQENMNHCARRQRILKMCIPFELIVAREALNRRVASRRVEWDVIDDRWC